MLFEDGSLKQTAFRNTFWLTVSNFSGRFIRALLLIYVARILGTEGYGIFSYAVSIAAFFSMFSDLGVGGTLTREGAKRSELFPNYVATSVFIYCILLTATLIALFAGFPYVTRIPEALPLLPIAALLIIFDNFRGIPVAIARAKERMEVEAIINIVTNLAITGIGIFLIFQQPTPRFLIAGYTIGSGIGTLFAFWLVRDYFRGFWQNIRPGLSAQMIKEGFFFSLMGLLGTLMLNTDMMMIGWLADANALGIYSAAQRPVQILYIFPMIISVALFPALARFAVDEFERFRSLLERALAFSLLAAIPLVIGGIALGDGVILLLFGGQYREAVIPFYLLLTTILVTFPGIFIGNAIFALDEQKLFVWFLTLGAIGNAVLNYLLLPRWGITGAAIATIIAQLLANGFTWWHLRKKTGFRTLPYLPRIIIASLLMGLLVYLLDRAGLPVIWNLVLSFPIYFGLLALFREPLLNYFVPASLRNQNPVG